MKSFQYGLSSFVPALMILAMVSCQQENPAEKAGKEITDQAQDAMDKAKEVENIIENAAEKTANQVKQTTK